MRLGVVAMTLLLFGCAPGPSHRSWEPASLPAAAVGSMVPSEKVTRWTLGNGADVLVLEDHRLPRVVLGVTLRRGARSCCRRHGPPQRRPAPGRTRGQPARASEWPGPGSGSASS